MATGGAPDWFVTGIESSNRFDPLRGQQDDFSDGDGDWRIQERKRRRRATGSVDSQTFSVLNTEDKLDVIFANCYTLRVNSPK